MCFWFLFLFKESLSKIIKRSLCYAASHNACSKKCDLYSSPVVFLSSEFSLIMAQHAFYCSEEHQTALPGSRQNLLLKCLLSQEEINYVIVLIPGPRARAERHLDKI